MSPRSSLISWFSDKKTGRLQCGLASRAFRKSSAGVLFCMYVPGVIMAFFLPLLLLSGCGYRFSPGGEHIDKGIQKVFVDNFSNRTSEANIENTFRSAFIDQFIRGTRFTLVDKRESADAVFRGSINSLTTSPLSYKSSNLAAEERIAVTMELIFEVLGSKEIIWTDANFSGTQDYPVTDLSSRDTSRKDALTKLSNDSAERAYRLMMSGF